MAEVAEELEFSEAALINELEHTRRELAPFADAWNKAKESGNVLPVEENTESDEKDAKSEEKVTESAENNTEVTEKSTPDAEIEKEETTEEIKESGDDNGDPY